MPQRTPLTYCAALIPVAALLAACSNPGYVSNANPAAESGIVQKVTSKQKVALQNEGQPISGYYLTKFRTTVGTALPESSFCFHFTASGGWSNGGSESFSGTYLASHKQLYASAVWLPSPAVYLALQGAINARRGSGHFIVSSGSGGMSGGGLYAMTQKSRSACS
jgi:hypothetical protein